MRFIGNKENIVNKIYQTMQERMLKEVPSLTFLLELVAWKIL
jgi:hypothetical protein